MNSLSTEVWLMLAAELSMSTVGLSVKLSSDSASMSSVVLCA